MEVIALRVSKKDDLVALAFLRFADERHALSPQVRVDRVEIVDGECQMPEAGAFTNVALAEL